MEITKTFLLLKRRKQLQFISQTTYNKQRKTKVTI